MLTLAHAPAPSWLRWSVATLRRGTTIGGLALLVGLGTANLVTAPDEAKPSDKLGMSSGPLDELMEDNRCSVTGFDRSVAPTSAIVRTPSGEPKLVSFERGWAVFRGDAAGDLVAVCLGPESADAAG